MIFEAYQRSGNKKVWQPVIVIYFSVELIGRAVELVYFVSGGRTRGGSLPL